MFQDEEPEDNESTVNTKELAKRCKELEEDLVNEKILTQTLVRLHLLSAFVLLNCLCLIFLSSHI